MYVRDSHRMTPDSRPIDTYPEGAVCTALDVEEDGMRTFIYAIKEQVWLKHLFTCNRSTVQKAANQLFLDLQLHVPLARQQAATQLGSGTRCGFFAVPRRLTSASRPILYLPSRLLSPG